MQLITADSLSIKQFLSIFVGNAGAMGSIIDEQQHQQNGTEEESASCVGCAQLVRQQLEAAA